MRGQSGTWPIARALFIGALVLVCANVLVYAARQGNPLIMSDDWVYLDSFVRKAAASDLGLADFFVKRSAMDHANPLRRLVLLAHYEWFGLDYSVQGLVGVLFAFANLGLLWRLCTRGEEAGAAPRGLAVAFTALAASYLSLNAGTIYTWPLLTLAFSSQFFMLLCILQAWKAGAAGTRRAAWILFAAAFAMDVVADDSALLTSIAIVVAVAVRQLAGDGRGERLARAARTVMLPVAAASAAYQAGYWLVTRGAVIAAPLSDRLSLANKLHALAGNLPELLAGVHVPLVAALLQKSQLSRLFDAHAGVAEWALAAMVAGAHACFWWRALRRRTGAPGFAAMVLMLYFYAAVAGILVARASLYGANYFWQPRYVILYQLSVVALVLMAIDAMVTVRGAGPQARGAPAMRVAGLAIAGAILLLQFKLSVATWGSVQASSRFQARLAGQIGALARHPDRVPDKCAPALIICRYPPGQRAELVGFLADNKLNVFSPSFQARYRLSPDARPAATRRGPRRPPAARARGVPRAPATTASEPAAR